MKTLLVLLFFSTPAHAGVYLDLSAEVHNERYDSFYQKGGAPIKNVVGSIELGYEFNMKTPMSVFVRHSSSMQQEDTGFNSIGVRVRIQ